MVLLNLTQFQINLPIKSIALVPKNSPRIVTLVPGGPSLGEIPVTTGGGPMVLQLKWKFNNVLFTFGNGSVKDKNTFFTIALSKNTSKMY